MVAAVANSLDKIVIHMVLFDDNMDFAFDSSFEDTSFDMRTDGTYGESSFVSFAKFVFAFASSFFDDLQMNLLLQQFYNTCGCMYVMEMLLQHH